MVEEYFRSFGIFTRDQIAEFVCLTTVRSLHKGDYFAEQGKRCNEVAFIKSGVFRSYYTRLQGDDITYCFRFPGALLASYSSYITGKPSVETIQAISSAELLVITKNALEKLVAKHLNWHIFLRTIAEQQYLELEQRIFQLQKNTAAERYAKLLQDHPEYLEQIPLQYLASFLGITQRHLSRIRKEICF